MILVIVVLCVFVILVNVFIWWILFLNMFGWKLGCFVWWFLNVWFLLYLLVSIFEVSGK